MPPPPPAIRGGTDIKVTLPGFYLDDLTDDDVLIYSDDYDGNFDSVGVSGSTVTLAVPINTDSEGSQRRSNANNAT